MTVNSPFAFLFLFGILNLDFLYNLILYKECFMKNKINKIGLFNICVSLIIIILWILVLFIHGYAGAVSWGLLKLFLPFIGIVAFLINFVLLLINLKKKKPILRRVLALLLCIVISFPFLFTMNVIMFAYPVNAQEVTPSVTAIWPLTDKTVVGWGGDTTTDNLPHVTWASERWAYDLVMEPYNTGSSELEGYGIWDKEVVAPVSGIIVEAYDDEDDILPNTEEFKSSEGNHVYIKIDETGTYLLLNHFKKDSVTIKTGDHVNQGEVIGRVGNSGSTSEPHLHIQHQRQDPTKTVLPIFAEGLPLYFKDTDAKSMPLKSTIVMPNK